MPFKSEKQRRYLFANEPELAKKWSNMYGKKIIGLGSLTKKEMMEIIKKGEISKLSKKDKKQLFEFAFGKSYMKSSDKGKKKKYKEIKRITGLGGVSYSKFYDTIEKYYEKKGKKSSLPKGLYNRQEAIDSLWNSYKNKKNWTSQQMLNYGGGLIPKLNKISGLGGVDDYKDGYKVSSFANSKALAEKYAKSIKNSKPITKGDKVFVKIKRLRGGSYAVLTKNVYTNETKKLLKNMFGELHLDM